MDRSTRVLVVSAAFDIGAGTAAKSLKIMVCAQNPHMSRCGSATSDGQTLAHSVSAVVVSGGQPAEGAGRLIKLLRGALG